MTEILNVKQVREILDLSERTIFRLISKGKLKGFKAGREWRFEQKDIDAFIEHQRQEAEDELVERRQKTKKQKAVKPAA